jgi:flagellar biosynthesis activator protein FlaF
MYQTSYAECLAESPQESRDRERLALEHAIALLECAAAAGVESPTAVKALFFLSELWRTLIEDLRSSENDLPVILRGDLLSVGLWILKEVDLIHAGRSANFGGLIEICAMIRDGLR